MKSYHGTSSKNASSIVSGTIDVKKGGGELGRGFYSGEHLHEAKAWAFHVSEDKTSNVIEITTADDDIDPLDLKLMDTSEAGLRRHYIRNNGKTRTFLFNKDMVWAPIVGSEKVSGDQYKWESNNVETLLNDTHKTQRKII